VSAAEWRFAGSEAGAGVGLSGIGRRPRERAERAQPSV